MKVIGIVSTAALSLLLGIAAPIYAQQDQQGQQEEQKAKSAQGENKSQQDKPAKKEGKAAQRQDKNAKQVERSAQQQDKNTKHEEKNAQQQTQQAKPERQAQRAGGNGGGRIPDERFRANFGREHRFRVSQADYSRDRRFQYGGYWFGFVDPWPSNWLYTQEVFVVEIGGVYYLCNPMYPGVNIALSFAL